VVLKAFSKYPSNICVKSSIGDHTTTKDYVALLLRGKRRESNISCPRFVTVGYYYVRSFIYYIALNYLARMNNCFVTYKITHYFAF